MKLLIVIDMQNDFIDGALGTKEAVAIVPKVAEKIAKWRSEGGEVVFTRDTHQKEYLQTQEGKNLPVVHCVEGTDGWQISNKLEVGASRVFNKPSFGSMELADYVALGFFRIKNRNGEILKDFFHGGKKCKYSFLDEIPQYTSIEEIEKKIDIPLVKCDRGGFLFPFYNFIYSTGDGKNYLEVICTPNGDDKSKCFFTGGWTYLDEDDIRKMNEN